MWWILLGSLVIFGGGGVAVAAVNDDSWWRRFDALFKKYGTRYSVDWIMLKSIALNESSLGRASSVARGLANVNDVEGSKSSDGKSWGLMQVTLTTAKTMDPLATPQKLNNPEYSIDLGARYLSELKKSFSKEEYIVKSYNQGPGNMRKEISGLTSGYANEYWARYQRNKQKVMEDL